MNWFVTPFKYAEALRFRGAMYFFMILNFTVAQGGILYLISRVKKQPFMHILSANLFKLCSLVRLYLNRFRV